MMADTNKENIPAVPDMKLELVPVPVSDVDRAKAFYVEKAGFTLEVDTRPTDTMRSAWDRFTSTCAGARSKASSIPEPIPIGCSKISGRS